jgi:hypothetical protein
MLTPTAAAKPMTYGAMVVFVFDFWIFVLSIQAIVQTDAANAVFARLAVVNAVLTVGAAGWFVKNYNSDMATVWTIFPAGFATGLQLIFGVVLTSNDPVYASAVCIIVLAAAKMVSFVVLSAVIDRPVPEPETPLIGNNWPADYSAPTYYRTMPNSYAPSPATSPFSS